MPKGCRRLIYEERCHISALKGSGRSNGGTARRPGRGPAAVGRGIRRSGGEGGYAHAEARRSAASSVLRKVTPGPCTSEWKWGIDRAEPGLPASNWRCWRTSRAPGGCRLPRIPDRRSASWRRWAAAWTGAVTARPARRSPGTARPLCRSPRGCSAAASMPGTTAKCGNTLAS